MNKPTILFGIQKEAIANRTITKAIGSLLIKPLGMGKKEIRLPNNFGSNKYVSSIATGVMEAKGKRDPVYGVTNISGAFLPESLRGIGIGRKLYGAHIRSAYEEYSKNPLKRFFGNSNTSTSGDAHRVWDSLARRGYPVEKIEDFPDEIRTMGVPSSKFFIDLKNMKGFYKDKL